MTGSKAVAIIVCAVVVAGAKYCSAANMVLRLEGDPDSYFEVPDDDSLDVLLGDAFTVEAWVNPDIVDGENLVVNKEDVYEIAVNGGTFQTAVQPAGQGWVWMNSQEFVPEGEWTHIATTWDGEFVSTFVNGEFIDSFELFGDEANDSPDTLKVGRRTRGGDTHSIFTGMIDEVRISKVVRYDEGGFDIPTTAFAPDDDTVALYHFDVQANGVVKDESSFGNDGVLLNDATLEPDDFLSPAQTVLWAGDSNMDLKFDQLDLVQVQIAAKYLSGQAATWGEGDWDGAPGGTPGDPPAGNGRFDQVDIIAALGPAHYLTGPYAAINPGGNRGDGQTSIVYNPATGELAVDAPAGIELTSINIDSATAVFTGDAARNLGGSFDNDADNNIFKATFGSSFGSLTFGNVAQTGLSQEFVLGDLTVIGSLAGGGDLGPVDLIYVPEPSTLLLILSGLVCSAFRNRRCGVRI